jgi:hypothetical protein
MIANSSVQAAIVDACDRCNINTPVECDHDVSIEGTGNVGSICGAINLIQPDNIDDSDRENLGKCAALIAFLVSGVKVVDEDKKEPAKKEASKKAPASSKKKAVVAPVEESKPEEPKAEDSKPDVDDLPKVETPDLTPTVE